MVIAATLTIENQSFDVLSCKYGFRRATTSRGYPKGGMTGGEILVSLESTPKTVFLEEILTNHRRPLSISGSLEFWDVNKMSRIRILEWTEAYI